MSYVSSKLSYVLCDAYAKLCSIPTYMYFVLHICMHIEYRILCTNHNNCLSSCVQRNFEHIKYALFKQNKGHRSNHRQLHIRHDKHPPISTHIHLNPPNHHTNTMSLLYGVMRLALATFNPAYHASWNSNINANTTSTGSAFIEWRVRATSSDAGSIT